MKYAIKKQLNIIDTLAKKSQRKKPHEFIVGLDPRTQHAQIFNSQMIDLREQEELLLSIQNETKERTEQSQRKF